LPWFAHRERGAGRFGSEIEEEIMAFVLIDTVTGTRRTVVVPVKACPQPGAPLPFSLILVSLFALKETRDETTWRTGSALGFA
jgi:hypothetical protein